MSILSGSYICKDKWSSVKQYHQTLHYFTSRFSINQNKNQQASVIQTKFHSIIQSQPNIYPSLCFHPQTHVTDTLRILTYILKPKLFQPHLHHSCQNITLTLHSTPLVFNRKTWRSWESNTSNNQIGSEMNCKTSNQKHFVSQRIPKSSKNILPSFHQK